MAGVKQWQTLVNEDTDKIIQALSEHSGKTFKKSYIRNKFNLPWMRSYEIFDALARKGFIVQKGSITVPNIQHS